MLARNNQTVNTTKEGIIVDLEVYLFYCRLRSVFVISNEIGITNKDIDTAKEEVPRKRFILEDEKRDHRRLLKRIVLSK